jgi:chorismate dehydratase
LRIGCVKYLNARPLIQGWPEPVDLDHPSALCRKLAAGDLDAALVSSFEFLRNPVYRIVDGVSIASDGPVYSVIVANRGEESLGAIELDPASQTSVALLRFLIAHRGQAFRSLEIDGDVLAPINEGSARLLIGDQAIRFRQKHAKAYRYWDLGEAWREVSGSPFVYALWLVRPDVAAAPMLGRRLRELRDANVRDIESIIAGQTEFDPDFCRRYYSQNLRFSLGDREKQGLRQFADVCASLELIPGNEFDLHLV